jgi:hypothetical protein
MITKILIDKSIKLEWDLQEKLLQLSNGFEVEKKELIFWVTERPEKIFQLLHEAKVPFETEEVLHI